MLSASRQRHLPPAHLDASPGAVEALGRAGSFAEWNRLSGSVQAIYQRYFDSVTDDTISIRLPETGRESPDGRPAP